jgi:hypothetical protein
LPINEVVKLNVRGVQFAHRVQFGHHFRMKSDTGSYSGLATAYESAIMGLVKAATSAEVTWQDLTVASVLPTGPETHTRPLPGGSVGTLAGEALPGQNSMLVSVHTGSKGRRRRGRFYVPGVSETSATSGRIIAPQLTALNALAAGLESSFVGAGSADYELVVYSPEKLTEPPPRPFRPRAGTVTTAATDLVADSLIVTQRRRRIGVGI